METLRDVLGIAVAGAFVGLAAAALRLWARLRDASSTYLALALLSFGLVVVLGRANDYTDFRFHILLDVALVAFVASGFFLLLFRHTFIPVSPTMRLVAGGAALAVAGAAVATRLPNEEAVRYSPQQMAVVLALLTLWALLVTEPAVRFWKAAKNRPSVQRARLRALSAGYGLLVLILFLAILGQSGQHPVLAAIINSIGLLLVPLLYAGFAPPSWLRRAWQQREEEILRLAEEFAMFPEDRATLARRAVDRALRIMGADAGVVVDAEGRAIAATGLDDEDVAVLQEEFARNPDGAIVPYRRRRLQYAILTPLRSDTGRAFMAAISGEFTPFFGTEEVARLQDYAALVGVALERAHLLETLREERDRYEALIQGLSDVGEGFVITEGGRCIYANDSYCRITGYTLEELQALPSLLDLSAPEERDVHLQRMWKTLAGEDPGDHYESTLVTKDDEVRHVEVAVKALKTESTSRIISIVRDITDKKRAETALARQTEATRLLQAVAVAANEAGTIQEVLQVAVDEVCAYLGWPLGHVHMIDETTRELLSTGVWHVGDERFEALVEDPLTARADADGGLVGTVVAERGAVWIPDLRSDSRFEGNETARRAGIHSGFGFPVLVGREVVGVMEFFTHDIAPPDPQLLRLVSNIGTQVGRVIERKRIEAFRDAFISNAAHELRTPVTAIVGFAGLVSDSASDLPPDELAEIAGALDRQSRRLQALVNNLLDFSRMQAGRLDLKLGQIEVADVVNEALQTTPPPEGKHVDVKVPKGLLASADPLRLGQIVTNLLVNAYKYGGGEIVVVGRSDNGSVELEVLDDGPGVPASLEPQLFDPFTRGEETAHTTGSGLGLAIVRMLARAQNGEVIYRRDNGKATRFIIQLKAAS